MARARTFPLGLLPPALVGKPRVADPLLVAGKRPTEERVRRPLRVLTAPVISGTSTIGQTLTSTLGSWSGEQPITYARQWLRDGIEISGATSDAYLLGVADFGANITCRITATNALGTVSSVSNALGPVAAVVPSNVVAPVVSGTATEGETLSCTTGSWTGTTPISYTFQWRRDGSPIAGATSTTYTLVSADVGTLVDCVVTATNVGGSDSQDSNDVGPIASSGGPTQVWDDLTALAGWTFSRASAATDGAPETGLPPDDVDDYSTDVLREVSAKLGLTGQPAYLLEGARSNFTRYTDDLVNASKWASIGSPTRTGGQADPKGGTSALRIQTAAGTNYVNGNCASSTTSVPHAISIYTRQGAGSGAWQATTLNPTSARGGTAGSTWARTRWTVTATGVVGWRLNESADRTANGGVSAGARDAVMWGPQVEEGAFASSFIDNTLVSETTRAADNARATLPAAWCADVLTVEYRPEHSSAEHVTHATTMRLIDNGTARLSLVVDSGASKIQLVTSGGTYLSPALTYSAGDVVRVEVDWSAGDLDVSVNATPVTTTSIAGSWTASGTAYIGRDSGGTECAFGVLSIGGIR